ncbi:MAG TPA: ABC transporter permease [Spirochaetota bacterium]|nr:ABC transporter permease [Spirochaetota bacterium]HOD16376.1 ABC transporter permease [Spirochaetota bacterium]HPN10969.1 ABC transporter permease [Spirochaetota bacterium]
MVQEQVKLNRLLNRVPLYEIARILFSKSKAEAKEFSRVVLQQVYFTFNQALLLLTVLAILIIARSCTAVATETAVMKYNREIEALELMGIPAVDFVFAPRILAGAISSFCMSFAFVIIAFFGTWLSKNWFAAMSLRHLYNEISQAITAADIVYFILKTTIVGAGIFWIACAKGLSLGRGSFEVPVVAMQAVVDGFIWAFATHIFFASLFIMTHGFYLF